MEQSKKVKKLSSQQVLSLFFVLLALNLISFFLLEQATLVLTSTIDFKKSFFQPEFFVISVLMAIYFYSCDKVDEPNEILRISYVTAAITLTLSILGYKFTKNAVLVNVVNKSCFFSLNFLLWVWASQFFNSKEANWKYPLIYVGLAFLPIFLALILPKNNVIQKGYRYVFIFSLFFQYVAAVLCFWLPKLKNLEFKNEENIADKSIILFLIALDVGAVIIPKVFALLSNNILYANNNILLLDKAKILAIDKTLAGYVGFLCLVGSFLAVKSFKKFRWIYFLKLITIIVVIVSISFYKLKAYFWQQNIIYFKAASILGAGLSLWLKWLIFIFINLSFIKLSCNLQTKGRIIFVASSYMLAEIIFRFTTYQRVAYKDYSNIYCISTIIIASCIVFMSLIFLVNKKIK